MWRQNPFPATADSDQSFSDDEDFDGDSSRDCISLSGCAEKEGGVQILSQLEKLRDASEANSAKWTSAKKQKGFAHEDEVEIPSFGIESGFICSPKRMPKCSSDEEMISDDEEHNVLPKLSITSGERKGPEEMSSLFRRQLMASHFTGSRRESKPKFSLGCYLQKDRPSSSSTFKDQNIATELAGELPENAEQSENIMVGYSAANNITDSEEEMNPESPIAFPVEVPQHGYTEHSIAELLDGLHERTGLPRGNDKRSTRKKGQRVHSVLKRRVATVQDSEDEPESMDSDSPGKEERSFDNLKDPLLEGKRQTLVDCFQEILDSTPWKDRFALAAPPNPPSFGLFGRLQQVLQNEKERELEFLNNLDPGGLPHCGISCLHVLILSSYLDAKLTVCRCSLEKIPERPQEPQGSESVPLWRGETTVIFSPRMCSNVDLEVGKLICISPPWKEVQLAGDNERILLATCFLQVSV